MTGEVREDRRGLIRLWPTQRTVGAWSRADRDVCCGGVDSDTLRIARSALPVIRADEIEAMPSASSAAGAIPARSVGVSPGAPGGPVRGA